jgi:hypothetical protein
MKRLIFVGVLVLITTAAQAQAYTTAGPQRDNYSTTVNVSPNTRRHRHAKPAAAFSARPTVTGHAF